MGAVIELEKEPPDLATQPLQNLGKRNHREGRLRRGGDSTFRLASYRHVKLELDFLPLNRVLAGPAASSPASILPLELLQEIVGFLDPTTKTDASSLRELSLVNTTFGVLGQSRLFSDVALWDYDVEGDDDTSDASSTFLSLLREAPHIAPFVISLEVNVITVAPWDQGPPLEVISSLRHIQHLNLRAYMDRSVFHCSAYPEGPNKSLRTYTFPMLTSLALHGLQLFPVGCILAACYRLEHLTLSSVTFPTEKIDDQPLSHALRSLKIVSNSTSFVSELVQTLYRAGCAQIHSLVLTQAFHAPIIQYASSTLTALNLSQISCDDLPSNEHIGT